jgi:hypothetical protein
MGLDPVVVRRYLHDAAAGTTTDAQGKAYEALAVYLFECVPGCFTERDIISFFGSEQIDVGVGNPRLPEGLALLPTAVIVECKGWARLGPGQSIAGQSATLSIFSPTAMSRPAFLSPPMG